MSGVTDDRIFSSRGAECPSELRLDRSAAGELEPESSAEIEAHVAGCAFCQSRMALRRSGFSALPPFDRARSIDAIHERSLRGKPWLAILASLRRPMVLVPLAAAPLVVLLLAMPPDERVATKGDVSLRVFRERGGQVEETVSGDRFQTGDRLRFAVKTPDPANLMIVSAEDTGETVVVYPSVGADRSGPSAVDDRGTLSGAVRLDAHDGDEWLHLIWCPAPFARESIDLAKPASPRAAPECRTDTFHVRRR